MGAQPPRSTDLKIRHAFLTGAELPRGAHGPDLGRGRRLDSQAFCRVRLIKLKMIPVWTMACPVILPFMRRKYIFIAASFFPVSSPTARD